MVVRPSVELGIFNDFTMLPTSVIQPCFPSTISQAIQTKTTLAVLKMKFMSIVISPYWQMIAVKQELERAEERIELVEYRSAERASEIEEGLDSYVTRVRHMHSSLKKSLKNVLTALFGFQLNRPFPNPPQPLFQSESKCESFVTVFILKMN